MNLKPPDELSNRLRHYEDMMADLGTDMLKINMSLDAIMKDVLSLLPGAHRKIEARLAWNGPNGYEIISVSEVRIPPERGDVELVIDGAPSALPWNELDLSAKDMLLNIVLLALSSDRLFGELRRH